MIEIRISSYSHLPTNAKQTTNKKMSFPLTGLVLFLMDSETILKKYQVIKCSCIYIDAMPKGIRTRYSVTKILVKFIGKTALSK
jgi:hypothetical protein